jgi:type I restriction enzyme, S subunit
MSASSTPPLWAEATLGDVGYVVRGVTYQKGDAISGTEDGYVPLLRATNITDGGLVLDEDLVFVPRELVSDDQMLRDGDIVIAASSGSIKVVGKTAQLTEPWEGTFGAFCFVFRCSPLVNAKWISLVMRSPSYRERVSSLAKGTNINNLKREHIEETQILVPPRLLQDAIVQQAEELLGVVDGARGELSAAARQVDALDASIISRAISGDLVEGAEDAGHESASVLLERISETLDRPKKRRKRAQV